MKAIELTDALTKETMTAVTSNIIKAKKREAEDPGTYVLYRDGSYDFVLESPLKIMQRINQVSG